MFKCSKCSGSPSAVSWWFSSPGPLMTPWLTLKTSFVSNHTRISHQVIKRDAIVRLIPELVHYLTSALALRAPVTVVVWWSTMNSNGEMRSMNLVKVLCVVFLRRNLNSKNIFVFYHCTKEKHFVNLEHVTTSYLLKSDVIKTHQELIKSVYCSMLSEIRNPNIVTNGWTF